jgi:hypothetical protein
VSSENDREASERGDLPPEFEYEDRVLAYVDILGWKDIIDRSAKEQSGIEDVNTALKALRMAAERARNITEHEVDEGRVSHALEMTLFSDTAVISCRPNHVAVNVLVSQVQWFCGDLMLAGLYARGSMVRGPLHHHDGTIVGPALVEAHRLESTVARYPRIVLSDAVVPLILDLANENRVTHRVVMDRDTLLILDPFGTFEERAVRRERMLIARQRAFETQEAHRADVSIRAKMGWLITFLTWKLKIIDEEPVPPTAPHGHES